MNSDPKAPKLIFHIGHHKTGSTSIQNALAKKAIHVEGAKILYPAVLNHNHLRADFDSLIKSGKLHRARRDETSLVRLRERLKGAEADFVVLSAESFEGIDPTKFRQVLDRFLIPHVGGVSIICYVRPHSGRTLSSYCESLKIGEYDGTLEAFHRRSMLARRWRYASRIPAWADVFGGDFILRPMERGTLYRQSVVEDFAHAAFGGDDRTITVDALPAANESLSVEDLVLLRLLHRQLGKQPKEISLRMGWELARLLGSEPTEGQRTKPTLHKSLAERIRSDYLADAQEMDRRYCGDRPVFVPELDKAVETAIAKEQSFEPEAHFAPAMIREITAMARLAGEMLGNGTGDWRKFMAALSGDTAGAAKPGKNTAKAEKPANPDKAQTKPAAGPGTPAAKGKLAGKGKAKGQGKGKSNKVAPAERAPGKGKERTGTLPPPTVFGPETTAPDQDLLVLQRLKAELGKRRKPLSQAVLRRTAILMQTKGGSRRSTAAPRGIVQKVLNRIPGIKRKPVSAPTGKNSVQILMNRLEKSPDSGATKLPDSGLRAVAVMSRLVDGMLDNRGKRWSSFLHRRRLRDLKLIK